METPVIIGKTNVTSKETEVAFSVPHSDKSTYEWTFPEGCIIIKNGSTNTVTVNWGASSGCVNVTETNATSCKKQYKTLFVTVKK